MLTDVRGREITTAVKIRTTINFAKAVYYALKNTTIYKVPEELKTKLNVAEGAVEA